METLTLDTGQSLAVLTVHTLVIGSGAAGLNAAVQLKRRGIDDLLIITEGLDKGTSINAGSDKQTYYKLALCGADADAPRLMAENYVAAGSMPGDLALVEAALSARAFLHLVNLGMPFPQDRFGQFAGYKTDHDPRQRATSIGPYTSREMCRTLIGEVQRLGIPVRERLEAVSLLTCGNSDGQRIAGALALDDHDTLIAIRAENVVFAVGGPGGLYRTSVYPEVHNGAIGLGLMAGARARNLPESQYGLASTAFRWNVSGTYMQAIPKFVSTAPDGVSAAREFLRDYFESVGAMNSRVFLKGYQWPFDARKVAGGSSLIDVLVYRETVTHGRRVFLDFRENPAGYAFGDLSAEARNYLEKSEADLPTPLARLRRMNPGALELYAEHGIDIAARPLEIAVCAQHNNGGLAANHWWESENIRHLFPIGEVNGSHGVARPGGAALNAGQVGGFRAAEFIAARYAGRTLDPPAFEAAARAAAASLVEWRERCTRSDRTWRTERDRFQERMSRVAAHIRNRDDLKRAVAEAATQVEALLNEGMRIETDGDFREALRNRHLCFAHRVYLEAVSFAVESGVGSRGSALVLDPAGTAAHPTLGPAWAFAPEDPTFREQVLVSDAAPDGSVSSQWLPCRPIPETDLWFETAWAAYRQGAIYD